MSTCVNGYDQAHLNFTVHICAHVDRAHIKMAELVMQSPTPYPINLVKVSHAVTLQLDSIKYT